MPANVKWQNVDFIKSDAYDWLERQFQNVTYATKEALEGLRVLGENGTLTIPKKYNQLIDVGELIGTGDGQTTAFTFSTTYVPVKKTSAKLTFVISGVEHIVIDDGNGALSEAGVVTGTINYTTGAISLTFVTAPDDGTSITLEYDVDLQTIWDTAKKDLASVYIALKQLIGYGDNLSDPV